MILQVLCVDAYPREELAPRLASDIRRRAVNNQDRRYHRLEEGRVGMDGRVVPTFLLDFRRSFSVFAAQLYDAMEQGQISRIGIVPPVYLHDLMHRFYSYLARVATPETAE